MSVTGVSANSEIPPASCPSSGWTAWTLKAALCSTRAVNPSGVCERSDPPAQLQAFVEPRVNDEHLCRPAVECGADLDAIAFQAPLIAYFVGARLVHGR